MRFILWPFVACICSLLPSKIQAQSLYFPPITGNTWDTISPASLGWCQDEIDSLIQYLDALDSKAFILLKDGKIVVETYFDDFTADSLWYWASAGKGLTSFLCGIAQQEGFLSINDTTSTYLGNGWTSCSAADEQSITIRNQLTMTTGLDDGVSDVYCTLPACLNCLASPGTRWAYHNGPYTLLDGVISQATGQNLNIFNLSRVKNFTGMDGFFISSGFNNVYVSKARGMARFGLLMLNRGNWDGTPILTDSSYFDQMVSSSQTLNPAYGYLWWLNGQTSFMVPGLQTSFPGPFMPNAPADLYAAIGSNGQFLNIVPSQNLIWLRLGNAPSAAQVPFIYNDSIWVKLNDVFCSAPAGKSDSPDALDEIRVFPNPVSDRLVVSNSTKDFAYQLWSLDGKLLLSGSIKGNSEIALGTIENGVYLLTYKTDNKNKQFATQRIVVNK